LKVISRTSVMQYKSGAPRNLREIGQQLGVAHLLEGSVQRAANRVRVNAQLIDARTDAHLWAQTYDRDLADVFAIQSEIAKAIAEQLQARLSPNEKAAIEQRPTADLAAYDLYVRAIALLYTPPFSQGPIQNYPQAVTLLDQAIARDPAFLLAYCKLGLAHSLIYLLGIDHTPGRLGLAERAVNAAIRLRPDSGDAHLALAQFLYSKLDYDRALAEIEIARRTLPNDPKTFELNGYIERRQGHWSESTRNLERALELDPRNVLTLTQVSTNYQYLRAYEKEAARLDRVLELRPDDLGQRLERLNVELQWRADPRPLHAGIDAILAQNPAAAPSLAEAWLYLALCERDFVAAERAVTALGEDAITPNSVPLSAAFVKGYIARLKGDDTAARTAFTAARSEQERSVHTQPDYAPALCALGLIDAALGRKDDALREARRAVELLPVARDSFKGVDMIQYFAVICSWTGEKDLALEQLRTLTELPSPLSYGELKLHPYFDPLRGDPRFESIVASLAPK